MTKGIKELFLKFEEGYIKRSPDLADSYMEALFTGENTMILGTSPGELCIGHDQCRAIIEGDWKYWGDIRIDHESLIHLDMGEVMWFSVEGTLKYTFKNCEETWQRYVDFGKELLTHKKPQESLLLLNWALANAVQPREGERDVYWPLGLTGAIVQEEGKYKFKYMQFFVPCGKYPDLRGRIESKMELPQPPKIASILREKTAGICDAVSRGDLLDIPSLFYKEAIVVGPRLERFQGEDVVKGLKEISQEWGQLKPDLEDAVFQYHGEVAWLYCPGTLERVIHKDEALAQEVRRLQDILESKGSALKKLIKAQIDISATIKELAPGEKQVWPCRFELAFVKKHNSWTLIAMTISFPFEWILEGRF